MLKIRVQSIQYLVDDFHPGSFHINCKTFHLSHPTHIPSKASPHFSSLKEKTHFTSHLICDILNLSASHYPEIDDVIVGLSIFLRLRTGKCQMKFNFQLRIRWI